MVQTTRAAWLEKAARAWVSPSGHALQAATASEIADGVNVLDGQRNKSPTTCGAEKQVMGQGSSSAKRLARHVGVSNNKKPRHPVKADDGVQCLSGTGHWPTRESSGRGQLTR